MSFLWIYLAGCIVSYFTTGLRFIRDVKENPEKIRNMLSLPEGGEKGVFLALVFLSWLTVIGRLIKLIQKLFKR